MRSGTQPVSLCPPPPPFSSTFPIPIQSPLASCTVVGPRGGRLMCHDRERRTEEAEEHHAGARWSMCVRRFVGACAEERSSSTRPWATAVRPGREGCWQRAGAQLDGGACAHNGSLGLIQRRGVAQTDHGRQRSGAPGGARHRATLVKGGCTVV